MGEYVLSGHILALKKCCSNDTQKERGSTEVGMPLPGGSRGNGYEQNCSETFRVCLQRISSMNRVETSTGSVKVL
jgi:hypothetical protein